MERAYDKMLEGLPLVHAEPGNVSQGLIELRWHDGKLFVYVHVDGERYMLWSLSAKNGCIGKQVNIPFGGDVPQVVWMGRQNPNKPNEWLVATVDIARGAQVISFGNTSISIRRGRGGTIILADPTGFLVNRIQLRGEHDYTCFRNEPRHPPKPTQQASIFDLFPPPRDYGELLAYRLVIAMSRMYDTSRYQ
jgi:hypothetical protein